MTTIFRQLSDTQIVWGGAAAVLVFTAILAVISHIVYHKHDHMSGHIDRQSSVYLNGKWSSSSTTKPTFRVKIMQNFKPFSSKVTIGDDGHLVKQNFNIDL
jgi:hypothetical protein